MLIYDHANHTTTTTTTTNHNTNHNNDNLAHWLPDRVGTNRVFTEGPQILYMLLQFALSAHVLPHLHDVVRHIHVLLSLVWLNQSTGTIGGLQTVPNTDSICCIYIYI